MASLDTISKFRDSRRCSLRLTAWISNFITVRSIQPRANLDRLAEKGEKGRVTKDIHDRAKRMEGAHQV